MRCAVRFPTLPATGLRVHVVTISITAAVRRAAGRRCLRGGIGASSGPWRLLHIAHTPPACMLRTATVLLESRKDGHWPGRVRRPWG
jgi:hypothetical protein